MSGCHPAARSRLDVYHGLEALVLMTNYFPSSDMDPWKGSENLGGSPRPVLCNCIH